MYYKNMNILKRKSIPYYNLLKNMTFDEYKVFGAEADKNSANIYINKENKKVFITSKNHRSVEASLIVDELLKEDHDEIVMFGIGNEAILTEVTKRVGSHVKLHIVEFKEVFKLVMENMSLSKVAFEKVYSMTLVDENSNIRASLERLMVKSNMNIKVFVLPQYQRHLPDKVEAFTKVFKKLVDDRKGGLAVNLSYQKLWIYNSIINFKHVISTPKFVALNKYDFKDSVALIVGAGPSLSYDIDLIKEISEKNNVYIFPIGSAYKALAKHGIAMDMLFSYDPTHHNQDVLSEYFNEKYDFPICFGSSIAYQSIRTVNYENAYHILTSQDYFANYLLEGKNTEIVLDAPSIVVIAIQALIKIGFKNFVFAGQNLSYIGEKNYADSIVYKRTENRRFTSNLTIKDVFGNDVYTNSGYMRTRDVIEGVISQLDGISFHNTTNGGAAIKGAPYIPLKDLDFSNYRKENNLCIDKVENDYDLESAKERFEGLKHERVEFREKLLEGFKTLIEIESLIESGNIKDLTLITKIEKIYNSICKMTYFKVLISKLDRSYINIFESSIIEINRETDLMKKYKMIYKRMGTVLSLFKKDDEKVNELFEYITKWIVWE